MKRIIFFFLGTEAELIKVFPVILECKKRNLEYRIIASGQNNISSSRIIQETMCGKVDLQLGMNAQANSGTELLAWWSKTYIGAIKTVKRRFDDIDFGKSFWIVHGDTVSTYMGARIGKKLGARVVHIEAGLRSHNLLEPFPEEIDRMLTSRCAKVHFASGEIASSNLYNVKGKVVNTIHNTLSDSLKYAMNLPLLDSALIKITQEDYFVFIMHRQENLMKADFVREVVRHIEKISGKKKGVIILHPLTKTTFEKLGILDGLKNNHNIVLLPRVDYFDFMKLLDNANFVITDGGSNQEELFYMGKPCLIMRKRTERDEGIGINGRLFDGDVNSIDKFSEEYVEVCAEKPNIAVSPSTIIVDYLENIIKENEKKE